MSWDLWLNIAGIVGLLIASAFFSGSETAFTAASRARMHQMAKKGSKPAQTVNKLRAQSERLIGAILIGNNLVNILAASLTTSIMIALFGNDGVVFSTLIMTAVIVIFSEVMPKTYALNNADRLALLVAPVVRVLVVVFSPVSRTVQILVRGVLRIFGVQIAGDLGSDASEEELRGAIELHQGEDGEGHQERAMLHSVLDLADLEVGEIMTHRKNIVIIDADLPPAEIIDQVLNSPYTRIPLWRNEQDNIIGVLHAKALLRELRGHGGNVEGIDVAALAAQPWFIPDSTTLFDQLQAFRTRREHFALVVDEYGTLMGIVTLEDILEEIVGEISDEHDVTVVGVRPQPDGSYLVDGTVTLRDINREFNWDLPDEDASTVAGLVLHESRQIPEIGQVFTFYGFRFEILRKQRHQITLLRLTPPLKGVSA
ncbi:MAG: HlyC/CorC family transporter [Alphaproteobacteria bacterium]|nr:HlyC/CorC family transporter [Alphaproteobacteria bacterium]MBU0796744.1 HlyC/CorC family transporter [Alphaproteobacteria bacterium]MBU0889040.1 HlyC/CorC family transporter [Alphaproteobacteria bacterium]MBU1814060.1 HlyC/CorC family transporter [Alphaproteobacteria bacterium]